MTTSIGRFVAALLAVCSLGAWSAPRALLADGSRIEFSVKQMGVAVSGQFRRFDAKIDLIADDVSASSATVTVDISSLSTGDADADAIALDAPWLNGDAFPQARFTSSAVRRTGDNTFEARGTLEIRGKAREVTVPFETATQNDGSTRITGGFTLRRSDFGIGGGEWNEGDLVADEVPVRFTLRLAAP
ncbi:YceI family protein [Sinimarinibacterium thermocellulolyticum]|uniref:YceI family protein n=1 Tax=Sinimarinibacterium thermocellulolyticum TaxID=3170016 RepID=A0ABV2ADB7_9GAMM